MPTIRWAACWVLGERREGAQQPGGEDSLELPSQEVMGAPGGTGGGWERGRGPLLELSGEEAS